VEPWRPDNLMTFEAYRQCFLAYEIEFPAGNDDCHIFYNGIGGSKGWGMAGSLSHSIPQCMGEHRAVACVDVAVAAWLLAGQQ